MVLFLTIVPDDLTKNRRVEAADGHHRVRHCCGCVAAYESPDYQAARKLLGDGAVRDIRIVEGATATELEEMARGR
jgi:hypothetical protein